MDAVEKRRNAVVDFINMRGEVGFADLKSRFSDVSDMTLRTDLKQLDEERRIIRVHGGAKSVDRVIGNDDLIQMRQTRHVDEKKEIAAKALSLVGSGQTIFLDSGSTTTELAKVFPDNPNILYTSSLFAAAELSALKEPEVYLPGGRMNRNSLSISGASGIRELSYINFDMAFIGVTGYSTDAGFSSGAKGDTELKRAVIERSKKVVVLMDASKLEQRFSYTIAELADIDVIVTAGTLTQEFIEECKNSNLEIL